ncbi:cation-translocating P-type ATPase [Candidatus Soleaferrea massiliensis]|uniref:cation-translocating P-type ATPase n=1 Tax=Candidatus Soleaferrea massiliensis TaxID=1470354 RepID=UPI000590365A|nr:HAD-IC family P-type ATPase [Candidatus Soleaferrea massiliensis]
MQIERFHPNCETGLTKGQVAQRNSQELLNVQPPSPSKTVKQIILGNLITPFNILNLILAVLVLSVGSYRNVLFIGVAICNTIIGTFQEIRSKRTLDKLKVISAPQVKVIRDGKEEQIGVEKVVLDDIMSLRAGNQICADSIVEAGSAEVDESLLTGEADAVQKNPGDMLLSGSFLVSGSCKARVEHIGEENYAAKLTLQAKQHKKVHSELMDFINKIIKIIGVTIVPLGILMFCTQFFGSDLTFEQAIVNMTASIVGMIPEGLVLLTSVALAIGVINLARRKTLVQELYCIETLALVDVLCLDKTGTITSGKIHLEEVIPVSDQPVPEIISSFVRASGDSNATFEALREAYGAEGAWQAQAKIPFSSSRKLSAVQFEGKGSYVLGAPEFVLNGRYESTTVVSKEHDVSGSLKTLVERYSAEGFRVLVLAHSDKPLRGNEIPDDLSPSAILLMSDTIRENAQETLRYFASQDVQLKVISGDNPITVSQVARRAGVQNAEKYIDAAELKTEEQIEEAVEKYTVFGRVTPEQKRSFVNALKKHGHTVAMTGDGVNDVLALKDADCSIAMAQGSDATKSVAQLVLLDSDFAAMPRVVAEGRRVINNIRRSSSLFLVKTLFSFILSILIIILNLPYPFIPIQLTLVSTLTIGFPGFILSLEPNERRVSGSFFASVLQLCVPGAVMIVLNVLMTMGVSYTFSLGFDTMSTMAVILTGFVGLLVLWRTSLPFTLIRRILLIAMAVGFVLAVILLKELFMLVTLNTYELLFVICMIIASVPLLLLLEKLVTIITVKLDAHQRNRQAKKAKA